MRGKRSSHPAMEADPLEHPRVCGENAKDKGSIIIVKGTSPRMRGKPNRRGYPGFCNGNIPAYAGKTRGTEVRNHGESEHPRVCGENAPSIRFDKVEPGTSPRMRGKRG